MGEHADGQHLLRKCPAWDTVGDSAKALVKATAKRVRYVCYQEEEGFMDAVASNSKLQFSCQEDSVLSFEEEGETKEVNQAVQELHYSVKDISSVCSCIDRDSEKEEEEHGTIISPWVSEVSNEECTKCVI